MTLRAQREKEAAAILIEADMVIANAILEVRRREQLLDRMQTVGRMRSDLPSSDPRVKARRKLEEARARLYSLNEQREEIAHRIKTALIATVLPQPSFKYMDLRARKLAISARPGQAFRDER